MRILSTILLSIVSGILCASDLFFDQPLAQDQNQQQEYLTHVNLYLVHPYVALPPTGIATPTLIGAETINIVDLRGNPDFAQPNALSVCGTPDTIPLLLFTKSIDPIFDAELSLNFGTGLESSGFAYVASGNADLDTVNVENPANPVFRIDEISLATGSVVVYVGIQAACSFLALSEPEINFSLDYVSGGAACTTTLSPEATYGGSVLQPQVGFSSAPARINITDATTTRCANLEIEQTTPNTSAQGAIVTVSTPHLGTSVDLVDVQVEGTSVPAGDIVDNGDGTMTITLDNEANPGYFGADGLTFGEGATLSFCYLGGEECFSSFDVNTSIVFACRGELCGGGDPSTEDFQVRANYNLDPQLSLMNVLVNQQPSACGIDGTPNNYIFQFDLVSASTDFRADITNLTISVDSCITLVPDTMYLAGANPGALSGTFSGSNGRITLDLDRVTSDPDGPGVGLDDLDGDGNFDDLPGGETLTIVFEFAPDVPDGCGGSDSPICNLTDIIVGGRSNCNLRGLTRTGVLTDDFSPLSTAGTGGDTTTFVQDGEELYGGFNFGTINGGNPSSTLTVDHSYDLDPTDLACTTLGRRLVEVRFIGGDPLTVMDAMVSNVANATLIETTIDSDTSSVTWLLQVTDASLNVNTVSFDITMDSLFCTTRTVGTIDVFTIDECLDCPGSPVFRACTSSPFNVTNSGLGPCTTTQSCNSEALLTFTPVTTGYTDRTLGTKLTAEEAAAENIGFGTPDNSAPATLLQVLPGDTVAMKLQVVVTEPDVWNGSDRLRFALGDNPNDRSRVTHLWDYPAARLADFSLSRIGGSTIDLGGVSDGQGVDEFYTVASGATVSLATSSTQTHPGLSHNDWRYGVTNTLTDLQVDGGELQLDIRNSFDGTRTHVDEIYAAIGGEFLVGDTINLVWWVPMMRAPRTSGHSVPSSATGAYTLPTTRFDVTSSSQSYITDIDDEDLGELDGNKVVLINNECSSFTSIYFHEPMPKSDVSIEYLDDNGEGCDAQIVINYTVDDVGTLIAQGAFTNEYRPILGLEQFTADIPASFYLDASTVSYELLNTPFSGSVAIDQSTSDVVSTGGSTFLYSGTGTTTITFRDAELDDGTNWLNYVDDLGQGEIDVTQIGGELPLLGIGGEAIADPDTLQIIIPLKRLCPMDPTAPLTLNSTLDYPYLPDYSTAPWLCSNAGGPGSKWFFADADNSCPSTPGEPTWSFNFNRGTDGNAHRLPLETIYQTVNSPDPYVAPTTSLSVPSLMDTDPGSESNTYTFTANSDLGSDNKLYIKVANAIDLLGITGDATAANEVSNDATGTVYEVEMGTLNTGDIFTIDLETEQLFCETAEITISTLTGCVTEESAAIAGLVGLVCPDDDTYIYESGATGLELELVYNTAQIGCAPETYTLNYNNTGTSSLFDFSPVVFLQEGLDIIPNSFMVMTSTSAITGIDDPTEDSALTGVTGVAYTWPAGYLDNATFGTDEVVPGELVSISFMAQATCDFTSGLPISTSIAVTNVCGEPDTLLATGEPISTVGDAPLPNFDVQLSGDEVSCGELAEPITITMLNTGANVEQTEVCFTLPPGVTLTEAEVEAIAPADYIPVISPPVPVGTDGTTQLCIQGPMELAVGEFICLNISPDVTPLECGEVEIGLLITSMVSITCGGVACDVSAAGMSSNFGLKVVPPLAVSDASLVANCNPTDGLIDIQVEAMLENLQADDFVGNVEVSLFSDINSNGELEDFETLIAGPSNDLVNAASGELLMINPSFTIPASDACPLLLQVSIPGCECSDLIIPFDEVSIPLAEELGEFLTICPGEPYVVSSEICGDVSLAFDPVNAGSVVDNGSGLEIALNTGFGTGGSFASLVLTTNIGGCGANTDTIYVSQLETFEFEDVTVTLCEEGCQTVSLGVDPALEDDMVASFSPNLYITDATSVTPEICDPASSLSYDVELMLNGQCTANLTLAVTVVEAPTLTITPGGTGCQTGFDLAGFVNVSPADLGATFSTSGTGTFAPSALLSDSPTYTPSPEDIQAGEVLITVRTDNPDGPCAGLVARETFTILLVDCGSFFWDGERD